MGKRGEEEEISTDVEGEEPEFDESALDGLTSMDEE